MDTLAFVCAVIGLTSFPGFLYYPLWFFGMFAALVAIVLGIISRKKKLGKAAIALAVAGIVANFAVNSVVHSRAMERGKAAEAAAKAKRAERAAKGEP